jgi:hypothetical protein
MSKPVLMVPQNCYRRPLATRAAVIVLIVAALVMVACGSPTEPVTAPTTSARNALGEPRDSTKPNQPSGDVAPLQHSIPTMPWW